VKKRHKALIILAVIFVGIPAILWLSWTLSTPRPISVLIMDKTSYSPQKANQRAINWVLTHRKYVKPDGKLYDPVKDYYGFFAQGVNLYEIRDLSKMSRRDIQQLANQHNVTYYADSYGIYTDIWPELAPENFPAEFIYGGLDEKDFFFLEDMINKNSLVIAEFLFTSAITRDQFREKAESMFNLSWKGWTGKFFPQFDLSKENRVSQWAVDMYESQYGRKWDFTNTGVVLVHEDERIVVLEYPRHLNKQQPHIVTEKEPRREFGVSNNIPYPGWFEITFPTQNDQRIISWFELDLTEAGKALLKEFDIPAKFPAVIEESNNKSIIYLAGDFSYTPIPKRFVRMKGARYFELFLSDLNDATNKSAFFFGYYLPLFTNVLKDNQEEITSGR
jgi:hypothetical protein